jgi:hypothetical protein
MNDEFYDIILKAPDGIDGENGDNADNGNNGLSGKNGSYDKKNTPPCVPAEQPVWAVPMQHPTALQLMEIPAVME